MLKDVTLCIRSEHCYTTPDTMDVSDGVVDLLPQLPLIRLKLKTNGTMLVTVERLLISKHHS